MKDFFLNRWAAIREFLASQEIPITTWHNLARWQYWSEIQPATSSPYTLFTLGIVGGTLVTLLVWRHRLQRNQRQAPLYAWPINQLTNLVVFIVVVTISYLFFWNQGIIYLSSRLVVLASLLVVIGWIGWLIAYQIRVLPTKRRQYLEQQRYFRYLPQKKEKK